MKLINVKTGTSGEGYELWADEKKLAAISFSSRSPVARVVSNSEKRLFFFEKKGILAHRTIIKNEYGIKMGEVEEEKPGTKMSRLVLNEKNYYYIFNKNNSGELKVYDEATKQSLLTCSFNTVTTGLAKTRSLTDTKFPSLLLVLCWYAFQPHTAVSSEAMA